MIEWVVVFTAGGNDDCICMYMGILWSVQLVCALMMNVFVVKVVGSL